MARKKRIFEQVPQATTESKEKIRYEDPFQKAVGKKVEDAAGVFAGQGRNILYGLAAAAVLGLVIWIIYSRLGSSNAEEQPALGKAIETSQAQISMTPPLAGSTQKTFTSQKERAEASIAEFQAVVDKFGGAVGEKAKYFVAANKLTVDRGAAIKELEALSASGGEVGSLSKFALAQTRVEDGKADEAIKLYQELAGSSDTVVAKETVQWELAKLFEKQGKKEQAVDTLFAMVKTASETKDLDGKAVPLTTTVQAAKQKLQELDPVKAKEIPEPVAETPGGLSVDN